MGAPDPVTFPSPDHDLLKTGGGGPPAGPGPRRALRASKKQERRPARWVELKNPVPPKLAELCGYPGGCPVRRPLLAAVRRPVRVRRRPHLRDGLLGAITGLHATPRDRTGARAVQPGEQRLRAE